MESKKIRVHPRNPRDMTENSVFCFPSRAATQHPEPAELVEVFSRQEFHDDEKAFISCRLSLVCPLGHCAAGFLGGAAGSAFSSHRLRAGAYHSALRQDEVLRT